MCAHGDTRLVNVLVPQDLSFTDQARWQLVPIDSCIASIVKALSDAGIHTRGCCCGHSSGEGDIQLQDGRALIILSPEWAERYYKEKTRILNILKSWGKGEYEA